MCGGATDPNYDKSDHCKEVFAHFGLAYYQSSVIESGIANTLLYGEFLMGWKQRLEVDGRSCFDRKVYEAEFDAYIKAQFSLTLGNLLKRLDQVVGIPIDLEVMIVEAKRLRDFLAHHYYRERAKDFVTREGRDRMINELAEMREKFEAIDQRIQALTAPIIKALDLRQDVLEKYTSEFIRKAYAGLDE
jgi:hypothetical protein